VSHGSGSLPDWRLPGEKKIKITQKVCRRNFTLVLNKLVRWVLTKHHPNLTFAKDA
jgi:hypothetical protein